MQFSHHFFGISSILVGLIALIYLVWFWNRHSAASQWGSTIGEILESHVAAQADGWSPHVRYTYVISGKHYTNDRIYLHPSDDTDERRALNQVALYPVGKKLAIYYRPNNPQDSVLDRRLSLWRLLFFAVFAVLFIIAGVAIYLNQSILS
jgi:hypothetical protein